MIANPLPRLPPDGYRSSGNNMITLSYAQSGIPVFPCQVGGKVPLIRHGFRDSTVDQDQVSRWWTKYPTANIGLATGFSVDVVDVDLRDSGNGFARLEELKQLGVLEGWMQAVRTPSGGLHLYFPSDPKNPRSSWSHGNTHIDFRGAGGYIIAPGSTITQGILSAGYDVIAYRPHGMPVDGDLIRARLTPAPKPIPKSLLTSSDTGVNIEAQTGRIASWISGLSEGERNSGLFWAACRMVELGASETDLVDLLAPPAQAIGLGEAEIRSVLRSAQVTAIPRARFTRQSVGRSGQVLA